ncbi:putative purine nucleoside protein [Phaeoacremonium minimum UCRPA7]|uniref:Putative purine nucleoside protein n=1 Tax=Phaeoacremonium minimum (strain UCR-PA7) TaxID=1286976 RepID=R8BMU8_PHAM7|nr:putative purine nucleoside protein [Phaeoacremonium minimum UCRPA7]EOO00723.1 putative purine nucleoside protein [Phaeoacremonium minimum UCRPA7]
MFDPEAAVWYEKLPSSGLGDLYAKNISAPGLSMLFPHVHCTEDGQICQVTTGESEINAASTIMAMVLSDKFDLKKTYFMIGGIAGVSPKYGTLGSVALARYAVQVALQYEFDAREMPENFTTGYLAYGTYYPTEYPTTIYGTEVFEVNEALREIAYGYAVKATLSDNDEAAVYRAKYAPVSMYSAATTAPSVIKCDSATSDVYYSGTLLSEAFENTTTIWTNGTGEYCMTAQEDNATLEVMVRMAIEGLVDFSRIIVMRTGSDFDRPPPGVSAFDHLRLSDQNGFGIAIDNIYNAGVEIIKGILKNWDCTFKKGIKPTNYIGDIFGSLGGEPDFGPGSLTDGAGVLPGGQTGDLAKRSIPMRGRVKRRAYVPAAL